MEFSWLESSVGSKRVQPESWARAVTEKAGLLARLSYSKTYALKRCEQDLMWSFGNKKSWPVSAAAVKKAVNDAYRSVNFS
ncbi:MAG: hypothetical protein ACPGQS_11960 [Bradymonadia bacterium]